MSRPFDMSNYEAWTALAELAESAVLFLIIIGLYAQPDEVESLLSIMFVGGLAVIVRAVTRGRANLIRTKMELEDRMTALGNPPAPMI